MVLHLFFLRFLLFNYWSNTFQEVDIALKGTFEELWKKCSGAVQSLRLWGVGINQKDFMYMLQQCSSLEDLWLDDLAHLLMPGRSHFLPVIGCMFSCLCNIVKMNKHQYISILVGGKFIMDCFAKLPQYHHHSLTSFPLSTS